MLFYNMREGADDLPELPNLFNLTVQPFDSYLLYDQLVILKDLNGILSIHQISIPISL